MRWKHAALLALAILAAGCSSNSKKELPPAELTDFKEEVVLHKQWSRSIGDGQGETYNMLVPAIDGDRIFASDVTGVIMALDRLNGDVVWKTVKDGQKLYYRNDPETGFRRRLLAQLWKLLPIDSQL